MSDSLSEKKSFEKTLSEFNGITNEEAYVNIFIKRMMKTITGKNSEFLGCNHRIDMLPFIRHLALPALFEQIYHFYADLQSNFSSMCKHMVEKFDCKGAKKDSLSE